MEPSETVSSSYFTINRKLLMIVFIWPYQKRLLKLVGQILIILIVYSMMIPQAIRGIKELQKEDFNVEIIVENMAGFLYFHAVLIKYLSWVFGEKKLKKLFNSITKDFNDISSKEERDVLIHHWKIGRLFTIYYMVYILSASILFVMLPAIIPMLKNVISQKNESYSKSLCYYAEYFIDEDEYFYYLFVHTIISVLTTIFITISGDTTFVSSVYHAIGLFNVIEFVDLIQSTYTDSLFIVTGLLLLALSLVSVDILLNLRNPFNVLRIGIVLIGCVFYFFYVSWPGQKIADTNTEVLVSIYFCGWYEFPLQTKYILRFMMMRFITPLQLTAGPLLKLNIQTFFLILKTAVSYFMVMASFRY